jgi:hypothetical protein
MSRGLGRVQNGCLTAIWDSERRGELPEAFDIAVAVYRIRPDEDGSLTITGAQHIAVKRALAGLQRKGRVIGFRVYHHERHFRWMSETRAQRWVRDETKLAHKHGRATGRIDYVRAKMCAIGMKAG